MTKQWSILAVERNRLKSKVVYHRREMTVLGYLPVCFCCNKPIVNDPYMHEAIITRGDVQRLPREHRGRIMVEENVVLYCASCAGRENTKNMQRKAILDIMKWCTVWNLYNWLYEMKEVTSEGFIQERARMINNIIGTIEIDEKDSLSATLIADLANTIKNNEDANASK